MGDWFMLVGGKLFLFGFVDRHPMGKLIETFGVAVNVIPIISRFSVTVTVSLFAGLDVFFIKPEETEKHRILVFFMEKQAGILVLKLA
jgi:hypothetical protein